MAEVATHRGCELGGDLLRLVADIELRDLSALFIIWWEHACQHPDESGLACAILPQHHQDLTVCKGSLLDIQPEAALRQHTPGFIDLQWGWGQGLGWKGRRIGSSANSGVEGGVDRVLGQQSGGEQE